MDLVLQILRLSDGVQRAYALVRLQLQASTRLVPREGKMELAWAPGAPLGRPRLAVISAAPPRQARPSLAWQCSCACLAPACLALWDEGVPQQCSISAAQVLQPCVSLPVVLPLTPHIPLPS